MKKHQNKLKKVGMQKEFNNWKKNVSSKQFSFQPGDRVYLEPTRWHGYGKLTGRSGKIETKGYAGDIFIVKFDGDKDTNAVYKQDLRYL